MRRAALEDRTSWRPMNAPANPGAFKRVGVLVAVLLCCGGCATVQPWERERLAHPAMADDPDPDASAFDAHVAGARDAALDPSSSGGGGCGCN